MEQRIDEVRNCTGCASCCNICPREAIVMKANDEGFLYPSIEENKCVNCGLCYKVCPVENTVEKNAATPECLAMAADDDLRYQSSSGAIFPLLAEYILKNGGCVCGAAWNNDNLVEHIIISDIKDLPKIKGSKYLQSNVGKVYSAIKKLLDIGKKILFSGTPCQVAGLNAYLGREYDNLLTIDLVCHGVPSSKVYKKYLKDLPLENEEKVINTNFRDKIQGWNPYLIITTTTTNNRYICLADKDVFMQAFLNNLCLREACTNCQFAKFPRQGDITLGDFWGIDRYSKKLNDGKGISLVLPNSTKGKKYIKAIKKQTKVWRNVPIKYAIEGNPCLVMSSKAHKGRKEFFERLDKMSLEENVDTALGQKYDCAILNLWCSNNYGALLTCYALQETIKSMGYVPRVINYILQPFKKKFSGSLSDNFADKYLDLTSCFEKRDDLRKLNHYTDTFIVGSDQVWRHDFFDWYDENDTFYLDFAGLNKKKIAYAASFGLDYFNGNDWDAQIAKYYLKKFDDISVREDDGVNICRDRFGVEAVHVLDPVFLPNMVLWDELITRAKSDRKNFIASYILDQSAVAKKVWLMAKTHFSQFAAVEMKDWINDCEISVEDWLFAIKNCSFFITDSFHGVCFALIFNKSFICIANKKRGYSRLKSLFKMFNIDEKYILDSSEIEDGKNLFEEIDFKNINHVIEDKREQSLQWLKNALTREKVADDDIDILGILKYKLSKQQRTETDWLQIKELERQRIKYHWLYRCSIGEKRKEYKQKYKDIKMNIKLLKTV